MGDLLQLILKHATDPAEEQFLREATRAHVSALLRTTSQARHLVTEAEQLVKENPSRAFSFDSTGSATLSYSGTRWAAGRFEPVSIGHLRTRLRSRFLPGARARVRLWVLDGKGPATDIGSLQATSSNNTLFQVASQFNCLESPGPYLTSVASYLTDPTQGPRASISAFPATLLRHYSAPEPGGERFVQSEGRQIDLLSDACGPGVSRNGYLTGQGVTDSVALATALEARFDQIRVGVHDDVQVVLGHNWDGLVEDSDQRRITQVFSSTVAGGGIYGGERNLGSEMFRATCRQLLRAAYLGTLLAAADLGRDRVVLTLIGGGVFQNPIALIWEAILWALDEIKPLLSKELDVILNGHSLGSQIDIDTEVLPAVRERGGALLTFNASGLVAISR